MDVLSKEQRRRAMQAVKSKDSAIELKLRKALWGKGYRYRKHYTSIVGKPDIAFPSLKIAIFCDSEFWHGYDWKNKKEEIKSNKVFWINKIETNIKRDAEVTDKLRKDGWLVLRFWGNDIKKNLDKCLQKIENSICKRKIKLRKNIRP